MKKNKFWKKAALIAAGALTIIGLANLSLNNVDAAKKPSRTSVSKKAKKPKAKSKLIANKKTSLVVYFSVSGNTAKAARQIAKDTGAKTYRIRGQQAYPTEYNQTVARGENKLRNNIPPAIKGRIANWNKYKTIYLGFPTWWMQPPMIIHTLFDTYSFKGKTIVPFTTSQETPMSSSMPYIRRMAKTKNAKRVINGFRYDNNNATLRTFLRSNKLIK